VVWAKQTDFITHNDGPPAALAASLH
jgi:hypothetical protein